MNLIIHKKWIKLSLYLLFKEKQVQNKDMVKYGKEKKKILAEE
jgi:hypothetical protein